MYKFFLPILLFLVGLWIYVGVFENGKKKQEEEANKILAMYESYTKMNDSIAGLEDYSGFTEVTEKGLSFFLPSYLIATKDLSETAPIQYKNGEKEFYVVLYTERAGEVYYALNDYVNATIGGIKNVVTSCIVSDSAYVKLNNGAAYKMDVLGDLNTESGVLPLKYKIIVTEHEGFYYDLTIWTTRELLKENEQDINRIISSVTFIPDINKAKENIY